MEAHEPILFNHSLEQHFLSADFLEDNVLSSENKVTWNWSGIQRLCPRTGPWRKHDVTGMVSDVSLSLSNNTKLPTKQVCGGLSHVCFFFSQTGLKSFQTMDAFVWPCLFTIAIVIAPRTPNNYILYYWVRGSTDPVRLIFSLQCQFHFTSTGIGLQP